MEKQMQLALNLVELDVLESIHTAKIRSKVSKKSLVEKLSATYPEFFNEHKKFVQNYIENHIEFKN